MANRLEHCGVGCGRGRPRVQTHDFGESKTATEDADLGDINRIVDRYNRMDVYESLNEAEMLFMDVTEHQDYATALRHAEMAEEAFLKLPPKARLLFNNSAAEWLDAAHDPDKRDLLVQAGEIIAPPQAAPAPPVVAPTAPPVQPAAPAAAPQPATPAVPSTPTT